MGYSNLAYKEWEEDFSQEEKQNIQPAKKHKKNLKPIAYTIIISLAAYYMISKNVMLYETSQTIKTKQAELTEIQTYNSQKIFELEESIDLAKVEEIATTELDMQRPANYQIEYVSVTRDDVTELTSGEVEGLKNKFSKTVSDLKRNIIGIFTVSNK